MSNIPMIVEKEGKRERSWDVYSRLFKDRIIFLDTDFNDYMASAICAQLLLLEMEDDKANVKVRPSSDCAELPKNGVNNKSF